MDILNVKLAIRWLLILFCIILISNRGLSDFHETAPDFFISNLTGDRFTSHDFPGTIIISFFFIDCIPCRLELPQLYQYMTDLNDRQTALLLIDPVVTDTYERLTDFADKLNIPQQYFYQDALGIIADKMKFENRFPTIVVIRNKKILLRIHEWTSKNINKFRVLLNNE